MHEMRPIATDVARSVVCMSVCALGNRHINGRTSQDAVWGCSLLAYVGPRNHALDGAQDRTNPFDATRSDNTAMRPLVKLFWSLEVVRSLIVAFARSVRQW